jgi:outer membrane protein assembly factor BamD (BamD/ComL family)
MRPALLLFFAACLGGCESGGSSIGSDPLNDWVVPPSQAAPVPIPNQVAGGNPNDPGLEGRRASNRNVPPLTQEQQRTILAQRRSQADRLWELASAAQTPGRRRDLYETIADDYPEHPRAAEARFLQGRADFEQREYEDAVNALVEYMRVAPVNPHAAEVERMVFESGRRMLAGRRGLAKIFSTDEAALQSLQYVAETFPAGNYADDALLELGRYHRADGEPDAAVLVLKELLRRYPDSEWSFRARLLLAETYMGRDTGDAYHAGFVDRDPREAVPDDPVAEAHAGPVRGALELALEQYEAFLERIALDPGRQAEYAADVATARARVRQIRERLAAKDRRVANWYATRGDPVAAAAYRASASRWCPWMDEAAPAATAPQAPTVAAPAAPPPGLPTVLPPPPDRAAPAPLSPPPVPPPPSAPPAPRVTPPPQPATPSPAGPLPPPVIRPRTNAATG